MDRLPKATSFPKDAGRGDSTLTRPRFATDNLSHRRNHQWEDRLPPTTLEICSIAYPGTRKDRHSHERRTCLSWQRMIGEDTQDVERKGVMAILPVPPPSSLVRGATSG